MSAPLGSILNDRDVSPPRSARSRAVEPISANSASGPAPFGPPEPLSAACAGPRSIWAGPISAGLAARGRRGHSAARRQAQDAEASGSRYHAGRGYGGIDDDPGQQANRAGPQWPPLILDPSQSVLAKRRRNNSGQHQISSSPPQSPPKRRRLPGPPSPGLHALLPPPSRLSPSPPTFVEPPSHSPPLSLSRSPPPLSPFLLQPLTYCPPIAPRSLQPCPPPANNLQPSPPLRAPPPPPFPGLFPSLLTHPELTLYVSTHLHLPSLVHLYTLSAPYHHLVNTRFTALLLAHAAHHTPSAATAFPFHCYRHLCRPDPMGRPNDLRPEEARMVPSFKWLQMVEWREHVVLEILALLQVEGLVMPAKTADTVCKLWFMMDMPDNARRIGIIRNEAVWSDGDLWRATQFFIKLDMRFTNPRTGHGSPDLRKLLLAQKGLARLWRTLRREECRNQLEVLTMAVRTHYVPPRHRNMPILGVPSRKVGALQWEWYGKRRRVKLLQLDQLVQREGIRRGLQLQKWYLDMALDGFVDKKAGPPGAEDAWEDIRTQDEVEVVDVEVDSEGEELEEESEWESEEDYFRDGENSEEGEEGEEEEDDKENVEDEAPGLIGLNLFFERDATDLNETVAQYGAYLTRARQEARQGFPRWT